MPTTVRLILDAKGADVRSVAPGSTVADAVAVMAEHDIGAIVVASDGEVVGLVSERDCARRVVLDGLDAKTTKVDTIMTSRVVCAGIHDTASQLLTTMTDQRFRHMPVVDGGKLVGMVSIGDLVKSIMAEQRSTIDQLEHYIAGG